MELVVTSKLDWSSEITYVHTQKILSRTWIYQNEESSRTLLLAVSSTPVF